MKSMLKVGDVRRIPLVEAPERRPEETDEDLAARVAAASEWEGVVLLVRVLEGDDVIEMQDEVAASTLRLAAAARAYEALRKLRDGETDEKREAREDADGGQAMKRVRAAMRAHRALLQRHLVVGLVGIEGLEIGGANLAELQGEDRAALVAQAEQSSLLNTVAARVRDQGPTPRQKKVSASSPSSTSPTS